MEKKSSPNTPASRPAGPPNISVILAEDHTIVRQGLRALLQSSADIEVVGEAADGQEAVNLARRLQPDVVVMDLAMEGLDGVEATRRIKQTLPHTGVLILSMHGAQEYVLPAVRSGADGYLLKGSGLSDLIVAIRTVAGGDTFFGPEAAGQLARQARVRPSGRSDAAQKKALSPREREVLELVALGHSSPQIATVLDISVKTVENHRSAIMAKLDIHHLAGLVRYAVRTGLISLHE
jgi:DNA-binding NarL/FixJ family response regulator